MINIKYCRRCKEAFDIGTNKEECPRCREEKIKVNKELQGGLK